MKQMQRRAPRPGVRVRQGGAGGRRCFFILRAYTRAATARPYAFFSKYFSSSSFSTSSSRAEMAASFSKVGLLTLVWSTSSA